MLDPDRVPPVSSDETVARYILFSRHFRPSDGSVKPDAFIPHPRPELSLTRHLGATDGEIWGAGVRVASQRSVTLYGRADVAVSAFMKEGLIVQAEPLPENPNHADALGWPADKAAQKAKALEIAADARFLPRPESG